MELITFITLALRTIQLTEKIKKNWYGENADKVTKAEVLYKTYLKSNCEDTVILDKTIDLLESIPNKEKDYILANSNLYLACCYFHKKRYGEAYRCLDFIDKIVVTSLSACKDIINAAKTAAIKIREILNERNADVVYSNCPQVRDSSFRLMVDDIFHISGKGIVLTGAVDKGIIYVGTKVTIITPANNMFFVEIQGIEDRGKLVDIAKAGHYVGLFINDETLFGKIEINSCIYC